VIAAGAFSHSWPRNDRQPFSFLQTEEVTALSFESGTRLREIGKAAFFYCSSMRAFTIPSSVETIGDRCFENCLRLTTITFEDASRLRKIGKRAFAKSGLTSITVPVSTQEIDGSAFVGCPLQSIQVLSGNHNCAKAS
jgi:hypothetical protein